jgi:hypothetical protein
MAGKYQHIIHRHFLKPFVMDGGGDRLWVFRRGCIEAVPVARDRAAAQRYYYSKPSADGRPTLDDRITDYEDRLKHLVERARVVPPGGHLDPGEVAEIAVHMMVRSSQMRGLVDDGARSMLSMLRSLVTDPALFVDGARMPAHDVPPRLAAKIEEFLRNEGLLAHTHLTPASVARIVYFALRERGPALLGEVERIGVTHLDGLTTTLDGLGAKTHTQVLAETLAPEPRVTQLTAFDWMVVHHAAGNAVIPDCVVVAHDAAGWKPLFLVENETLDAVVMPLAPDRLAVGRRREDSAPSLAGYNAIAAECSHTFFVGNQSLPELAARLPGMGAGLVGWLDDLTRSALVEALNDLIRPPPPVHPIAPPADEDSPEGWFPPHTVSFRDCADETTAHLAVERMTPMIQEVAAVWSLHGLAGITFAHDYAAAIREVDRGDFAGPAPEPIERDGGQVGIGMPVAILHDGRMATHLVFRGALVDELCAGEEASGFAWEAVVDLLGAVAWRDILSSRFSYAVLTREGHEHARLVGRHADDVFETYFRARLRAGLTDESAFESDMAADALTAMFDRFTAARTAYAVHGDHERLFDECADAAGELMRWLARLHGLRAPRIGPHHPDGRLETMLEAHGLAEWSALLVADLDRFHCGLDRWAAFEEIGFLSRHLERLVFTAGVFPDPMADGRTFVRVTEPWAPPGLAV